MRRMLKKIFSKSTADTAIEHRLKAREQALREELSTFTKENPKRNGDFETKFESTGESLEDAATDTEQYIDDLTAEHHLEVRLKEVAQAFERFKKGIYGACEKCGRPIAEKRLAILPEARLCVDCEHR